MLYSKDHKRVGVVDHMHYTPPVSVDDGTIIGKTKLKSVQIDLKCFQQVATEFLTA